MTGSSSSSPSSSPVLRRLRRCGHEIRARSSAAYPVAEAAGSSTRRTWSSGLASTPTLGAPCPPSSRSRLRAAPAPPLRSFISTFPPRPCGSTGFWAAPERAGGCCRGGRGGGRSGRGAGAAATGGWSVEVQDVTQSARRLWRAADSGSARGRTVLVEPARRVVVEDERWWGGRVGKGFVHGGSRSLLVVLRALWQCARGERRRTGRLEPDRDELLALSACCKGARWTRSPSG